MAASWARRIADDETRGKVERGVKAVTESPGVKAAAKAEKWQKNVSSARARARFTANSAAVPLEGTEGWKNLMLTIGLQNMATNARLKQAKMQRAMVRIRPILEQVTNEVRAMPDNTPTEREQRALTQMRRMRELSSPGGGGTTYQAMTP